MASTIDCGCIKMLNHGLNHGFFSSTFQVLYPSFENSTTCITLQCIVLDLFLLCTIRILLLLLHVDPTNILECIEIKVRSDLLSKLYIQHSKVVGELPEDIIMINT